MTTLAVFSSGDWSVRTEVRDGEPWFVAADVCRALGLGNPTTAVGRLNGDGLSTAEVIDSLGRKQTATVVDEGALYELIFQSRRPEAAEFRRWVTRDVLPAIRRTGTYSVAPAPQFEIPANLADALQLAADLERERAALAVELEEAAPKVAAHDAFLDSIGDYSVREAAQILARDHGIKVGRQRLFEKLRDIGWLDKRGNLPLQRHIDRGVLAVKSLPWTHPSGETRLTYQVRITPKGLTELHRLLRVDDVPQLSLVPGGAS